MTRYFQSVTGLAALVIAVLALGAFAGRDASAQIPFFSVCGAGQPESTDPGAATNINGQFGIGIGSDCTLGTGDDDINQYNSGGLITFTPPEFTVGSDDDIPDGTEVGTFSSKAVLGLLNNPCTNQLPVNFDLLDGTTDTSNSIDAAPPGTPNRLVNLTQDADGNGVPNGAQQWPSYLTTIGTNNGWDFSRLRARFVGLNTSDVPGTAVILNFLVFEPGSPINPNFAVDPRLGYPAVTVLQDPSVAASASDPVNDFCAPLETRSTLFGTAGGATFRGNPSAPGTYYFTTFVVAQPDADNDGIENGLDPCNQTADPDWNPRRAPDLEPGTTKATGDQDGDGLPSACDPAPDVPSTCASQMGVSASDEDCDGWANRADNCATAANPNQEDGDSDQIGDACDPDPANRTGGFTFTCIVTPVTIGSGGGAGTDPSNFQPCGNEPLPSNQPGAATPTLPPGATPRPTGAAGAGGTGTGGTAGGVGSGPTSGIGSLSPVDTTVPMWAAMLVAFGLVGLLGGVSFVRAWAKSRE